MTQSVWITGASKGIGLTIARSLQQAGYRVIGTSRRPETAGVTDVNLVALDITNPASIETAFQAALAELGSIDVLINNAGYDLYGAAEETSAGELAAQMQTNFTGITDLIRMVLPHMRQQGSGKIINISSIGGLMSLPYNSAYAASKFALEGYSESLRYELLPHHIYVSLVEPGSVQTDTLTTSIQTVSKSHPAYSAQRQHMVDLMHESGNKSQVTPQDIARTVQRIMQSPAPRLRYTVGNQARFIPLLKTLLPQRLFEAFILNQFLPPVKSLTALEDQHAR